MTDPRRPASSGSSDDSTPRSTPDSPDAAPAAGSPDAPRPPAPAAGAATDDDVAARPGPIAWMARNPIAANLLMVILIVGGLWSATTVRKEVFPQFQLDVVDVSVGYPGAAPAEVEQGILRPIEEAIRGVDGIREITSEAREGRGTVTIELVPGTDRMKAFQDVDQSVARIRTFPDDIDQPDVNLRSRRQEVMELGLHGPVDIWTLRVLAERLRDQLLADERITQVELQGVPQYVTHVEIPRDRLREYGLTLPDVARLIEASSEDVAAVTSATLRMFEEHELDRAAEGVKTNVRGGSFIDVEIVMLPPDERDMTARDVIELWRDSIGDLPGVDQITFEAERGPGGWRQDISIDLGHPDIDVLERAALAFRERAEAFADTRDVSDDLRRGKAQLGFRLLPEGRALGLTPADVGGQLRGAFYGSLALRLLRGTNEIEVRVKLPESEREQLHALEDLVIRTPDGTEVPLLEVVAVERTEAYSSITRRNGRRVINVSMDVEPKRAVGRVIEAFRGEVLPELAADHPGLTWSFEGSDAEMREATASLWSGFGLALVVIHALLAIAFRHYVQPLIVLVAIPFGIVGAVFGHILLGHDLSLISLMGVIALSGVVVNDSLIMIDHANRHRGSLSAFEAILEAGTRRFRPIFLTTATTFLGLSPIILEQSLQAQYIVPMAISLGFGIVFATAIILLLVPCLYLILDDLTRLLLPGSAAREEASGAGGRRSNAGSGGPSPASASAARTDVAPSAPSAG